MGLLGSSLAALAFMVNLALTNIYGNNVKWQLSSGDQISFPLYRYFETNRDYTIKYRAITTFTTKIISRDPVLTKEVAQGCKAISAMDKTEKEADNKLTMICNKNEVYESSIDGQSGKVTNTNLIYKFDGMECLALEWSKSLNAYGVFCIQVEASKAADSQFYIVNIIDRATLKLVGSSKVAFSGLNSYEFNGRIKIKFREVTKGTGTATVVLVFDESFTDNNVNIASKGNDFFLVTEIDTSTKKPAAAIQFVKFNSITTILKGEVFKSLTMEIYSNFLLLAFYSKSNLVKVARCSFTYATTEMAISGCILREHPIDPGYGLISFLNSDVVAYYNKRDAKFFTCKLYPNDQDTTQQIIKDCNAFEGRKGTDIDIKDFYAINDKNLKVYYMTKETKIDLGVDVYQLGAADPKVKLLDSFNTYCSLSTDVKSNYYTITDSFLDVFTKTRTEELLIQGSLVPQDKSNLVTIEKDHQGAISIKEIEVSQFPKFITAIQAKTNFPTLIGFLGTYFRIPIGRAYFSGNGINFELTGQLSTRIVSNAGDFQFKVDGENTADILAYHHTSGYAAMFMKNSRLLIVNCQKVIEGGLIALKCERIGERVDLRSEFNEQILATYHTPHMLIIVTTYGQFIFFNKVRQTSLLQNVQSGTRFFKQVSFKPKDAYILISVLATDSKGQNPEIQNYRLDEFSKLDSTSTDAFGYVSTITKDSYKAESNQETAGDFCPKSIDYELTDAPVLDVLNACATKDRRLLRFSMKDEEKPAQLSNTFIRLAELRNDKIQMCADLDTAIIASIDSPQAIGIGYESYNIQQNLGLKALNVEKVTKIVCLGQRAYALGLLTSDKKFKIATYFTRKLKYANERLHSLLEFSAEDGYKDFSGAESDGTIFYNIYSPGKPTLFRMVDLDGPELYVKSISRTQISDSAIACSNGESNALLPLPLSFKQQKQSVQVSSRNRSIEITKKKYDFGELCNVQGPVFDYKLDSEVTALTITPRVSTAAEFIPTADTSALKSLYFSRIKVIRDITFILSQMPGKSQILAKFEENQKPKVLNFILNQTCHNFDIVEETNSAIGFLVALNCFYNNEKRIHFVSLTLDGKHIYQGFSSVVLTSLDMAFTFSTTAIPTSYRYLFSNIDESNHLTIYSFNLSTSLDKLNAQISFSSIVHEVANVTLMKIIPTLKRINVMYFTHKDHKGNVFVIDNTNLTVVSQTHSTVVTTDFTIVSQFDCKAKTKTELIKEDYVDCVFATHGPHIYRVQLKEDPATGLVEVTNSPLKGKYELFFDDIPTKLIFNDNFLALLSLSVSGGKQRVLVYKFTDKNGSKYLWSGIKLKDHTKRLLNELDFAILPNNNLIFTTNSFVSSNVFSLSKSVALKEAEIQVNDADLDVLKQYKIKFNADQIDIEQAFVPLSNFFLHSDEQSSSILMTSDKWYHWVILSGLALLLYGYLFYRWKLEKDRRQKLREEVLCNNLGDEIRV